MRKIKIALLIDILEDTTGGAERQVYELIRGLNSERFEAFLFILHQDTIPIEANDLRCAVRPLGIKRIYGKQGITEGRRFARFLREEKIDIVMTYHFSSDAWGAFWAHRAGNIKVISNRRDMGFWRKEFHTLIYRVINRLVDRVVTVSDSVKNVAIKTDGISSHKVMRIYNGVELGRLKVKASISTIKKELGIPENALVVGCVGNFKPIKGQKILVDAALKISGKYPQVHFLLVGEDEYDTPGVIAQQIKELKLEKCMHLTGIRTDVPVLLIPMDICILPSLSEGLSNTLLEYMAAEKPIVATAVGGNPELIRNGENGLLVPSGDSNALAEALGILITESDLRARLGKAARCTVEESFSIETMLQQYETLFEELAGQKGPEVCHLISSNGLFGAEKVMLDIAQAGNSNGHSPWVIGLRNTRNPHEEVVREARKRGIRAQVVECKGRLDFGAVRSVCRFIRENNIGVLHTHNYKSNLVGLLAARKAKIPIIATLHGYIGSNRKLRFYEALDRFILRYFDKVILVDDSLKKWFKNTRVKYEVINNGVKIEESQVTSQKSEVRNLLETPENGLVIGTVGRLSEEKGHRYLIEAFGKLSQEYPDSHLLIVGDGELRKELEHLSETLGIKGKVIFTGYKEDVAQYYALMDIYASPSLIEHFPMSILEAMSFGKAIVATNAGGSADLIKDGQTGILVNPGSSVELHKALIRYIQQPALIKTFGGNAYQFVGNNYSLKDTVNKYRKTYEDTLCNA